MAISFYPSYAYPSEVLSAALCLKFFECRILFFACFPLQKCFFLVFLRKCRQNRIIYFRNIAIHEKSGVQRYPHLHQICAWLRFPGCL